MKTRLFAGLLLLGALGVVFQVARMRRIAEAETSVLEGKRAALRAEAFRAETTRKVAEAQSLQLNGEISVLRRAAVPPPASAPAAPTLPNKVLIAADPVLRASYLESFRPSLDYTYGAIFRTRGFSAAEIELIKALKTRAEERSLDALLVAQAQKLGPKSEEYLALMREAEASAQTPEEGELLARFDRSLLEFNQAAALRTMTSRLASTMIGAEPGLQSGQVEEVVRILSEHSQRNANGAFQRGTIDWNGATPALTRVLNPVQLATLHRMDDQYNLWDKVGQESSRVAAPFNARLANVTTASSGAK